MKKILSFLFLTVLMSSAAIAQTEIKWLTFEEAAAKTAENPKMVFVDVYTDWCGWCKKMDKETFTDPAVIDFINENFYAVKMNAEDTKRKFSFKGKEYTEATMSRAMRVSSYPNFVIMDATMENITQYPGYRQPDPFLKGLTGIVARFNK
ncbi:thioredoxin family protein [Fontibacter flavus]|uniref:Thioredoxin family protein n=1 Tax=Fontibacter flavus TaxID=654838 RepID=A0ABV6FQJ9_9BACT